VPVLLERDFNIPEMEDMQKELNNLEAIMEKQWENKEPLLTSPNGRDKKNKVKSR